ncbi:Endoribonuclease XendoU [Nesidiocoris tenuis]|uniref:Endoribonuclease XendoU n=1 Tax=Nesidiocoris tenuis TaxID=355587 RepID=A0ABN7AGN3_9HEMI|nr:Endoribonuclease XendoU [Nesidiocoris tenuis]
MFTPDNSASVAADPVRYISDDELKAFFEELLNGDQNNAANLVRLNLQARSPYESTEDLAPNPLLTIDPKVSNIPTVAMLAQLYDNYLPDAFMNEDVTPAEVKEEEEFMKAVLNTTAMSLTKSLLSSKGMAPKSQEQFSNFLKKIWFTIYPRYSGKRGSSAFEHIFLGEFKKGQVSGLHNWLFFSHEESSRRLNYYGWTKKIEFPKKRGGIIKLKYAWNGLLKPAGSMFVGTSPELELSVYTVCFLARPNDRCNLAAGGKTFHIQTYAFNYLNNTLISSAYPSI